MFSDPSYGGGYGGSVPYANFYTDLELAMKIGQVALIAFIVLVAVVVCFLLLMCCMQCPSLFGGGYRGQPQPEAGGYYPSNVIQGITYYIVMKLLHNYTYTQAFR